jgi:hypothetical protein
MRASSAHLNITEEAVQRRVRNIEAKLGANDRTRVAVLGIKHGIISYLPTSQGLERFRSGRRRRTIG